MSARWLASRRGRAGSEQGKGRVGIAAILLVPSIPGRAVRTPHARRARASWRLLWLARQHPPGCPSLRRLPCSCKYPAPACRFFGGGFGGFGFGQQEEETPKGHAVLVELEVTLKDLYLGESFKVGASWRAAELARCARADRAAVGLQCHVAGPVRWAAQLGRWQGSWRAPAVGGLLLDARAGRVLGAQCAACSCLQPSGCCCVAVGVVHGRARHG